MTFSNVSWSMILSENRSPLFGIMRLIELDAAVLEYLAPALGLLTHERFEFLRRAAGDADAGILQFIGNDGIAIHADDGALDLVDDGARRAGRRHKADPGRDVIERGQAGGHCQRLNVWEGGERSAVELGEGTQLAALDQRQTRRGAVDDVVDR